MNPIQNTTKVQHMINMFLPVLFLLWPLTLPASSAAATSNSKDRCADRCGSVSVPYPFGIGASTCSLNKYFNLTCENSSTPDARLLLGNVAVQNISVDEGTMILSIEPASKCSTLDNSTNLLQTVTVSLRISLGGPFTFSDSRNKLTGFGCNTLAMMKDAEGKFGSGCVSLCNEAVNFTDGGSCSGIGCCQTSVPPGVKNLNITIQSASNESNPWKFNPCGFSFLADQRTFKVSDLAINETRSEFPFASSVIEWVAAEKTCEEARLDASTYACQDNSECNFSTNGKGYRCSCQAGFEGNPYLGGCQDINECDQPELYPCHGSCKNTNGNYTCSCPIGMRGNGKTGCQGFRITTIAAIVGAFMFTVIIILLVVIMCKRRRKERNFLENGGRLLKHQRVRIFTEAELAKATKNYDASHFLGEGGFGSVYKGVLADNVQVAVKRPKDLNKALISEEFQHEIGIISQVNHKNVVKLLGLCLETKVPLLVYEYISNETIYHHIHDKRSNQLLTWENRLRIASETALAIDYLHSLANPPIIHGDIKSMNILLDNDYTAKVSDFGASVLISPGQTDIATKIQGTLGYLDPEYLMTGIQTEKSDVYSFGVVLVELLTGKKPGAAFGEKSNIIREFLSSLESNTISQLLGFEVTGEGELEEAEAVAELAKGCLSLSSLRRPTMKEVSEELAGLRKLHQKVSAQENIEESELLLGYSYRSSGTATANQTETHVFDVEFSLDSV